MPRTVQEIMSRELVAVAPDFSAHETRALLRSFRIGAAPVLDESRKPIGVVSLADALELGGTAGDRMSKPALSVDVSSSIEDAARRLAETEVHHIVVVDGAGTAVGMLSSLDALRALLAIPTRHPSTLPHWDVATGVSWTDDWLLDDHAPLHASDAAGVLVFSTASLGESDSLVWAEACASVRARLHEVSARSEREPLRLRQILAMPHLRFRSATVDDQLSTARIVALLRDRIANRPPPGAT